jgi:serine/threonine protein kinase
VPAPNTADELLDLVQRSGLLDDTRLSAYLANTRTTGALPSEPAEAAGLLVRDGILTQFQAEQLLLGKWRGFTIGSFKVLERIGVGRITCVYLCEHPALRRRLAVKVLPTTRNNDPVVVERFYRECRILASLDHPNIVQVHIVAECDKYHYLGMEYIDGSSLEQIVEQWGPLDATRAAHYLRQAALGLQHVCEQGFIHRDLKPSDILVDRSGTVKIIDFGLARFVDDGVIISPQRYEGDVLGTPDYIAPEQAVDPRLVDVRADLYSLGATFYFCLSGGPPFPETTVAQKLDFHQTLPPASLRQGRPEVPEGLAALIERMMAKDPAQRPQTPLEVAEALAPYTQAPIGPPPEEEMPRLCPAARGASSPGG